MEQTIQDEYKSHRQTDEDVELVYAAQQNPSAFEAIYHKWLKPVYRYFYFRLGNVKDAEDLTAQVFLKVFQDLPRYRSRKTFSAWLFSIAHARLVDHYRKNARKTAREATIEESEILVSSMNLTEQVIQKSENEQAFKLMNHLSDKEKTLICLRFMAELSYREIGQVLHCKGDTARKSVSRLLKQMRKQMEEDNDKVS